MPECLCSSEKLCSAALAMPRSLDDEVFRHVRQMMEMDWISRHQYFNRLAIVFGRPPIASLVADAMSPADLYCGRGTGSVPPPVIVLGDRVRFRQLTIAEAFVGPAATRRRTQ